MRKGFYVMWGNVFFDKWKMAVVSEGEFIMAE